ncbi:MAG TPA: cytidine deaminase [Propionibacteriaceae bacterium]|nr:cytidine deaminase [Propionibacteriaceae bacterium]
MSGGAVEPAPIPDDPEDVKLITLARAALGRTGAAQGAAVRDTDGRAYAAASVHLEHLELSAVAVAVAMAVSSGADGLEAVAVAGAPASENDLDLLHDLPGSGVAVWSVDARGQVLDMSQL